MQALRSSPNQSQTIHRSQTSQPAILTDLGQREGGEWSSGVEFVTQPMQALRSPHTQLHTIHRLQTPHPAILRLWAGSDMAGTGGNRRADSNIASKSNRTVSQPHPKPQWTPAVSLLDSIAVKGEDRNGRERVRGVCWHAEYSARHESPTCSSCDIYSLCGNDTKRSVDKKHVP